MEKARCKRTVFFLSSIISMAIYLNKLDDSQIVDNILL